MELHELFSSGAKVSILETLYHSTTPIPLRRLSCLAGVGLRSTQLALASLHRRGLIDRRRSGNQIRYAARRSRAEWELLARVFETASRYRIEKRSRGYKYAGTAIIKFVDSANRLIVNSRNNERKI